jgi:hypothetical protein
MTPAEADAFAGVILFDRCFEPNSSSTRPRERLALIADPRERGHVSLTGLAAAVMLFVTGVAMHETARADHLTAGILGLLVG